MHLTYSEYQTMGGTFNETQFNRFFSQAAAEVDAVTFGRISADYAGEQLPSYNSKLKWLLLELIEIYAENSVAQKRVASQSNEGVSVQFALLDDIDVASVARGLEKRYLGTEVNASGTPLLFVGV